MDERERREIFDAFFAWAVRKYFRHTFRHVHDPDVRFYRALEAASRPVRNEELVYEWHRMRQRKPEAEDEEDG